MPLTVVVGPGRAGCAVAAAHAEAGEQVLLVGRRDGAWRRWAARVGVETRVGLPAELPAAQRLLLAVPDADLADVARAVAAAATGPDGPRSTGAARLLAAHLSGIHDLRPLAPFARHGARVAALHPIVSFPEAGSSSARAALLDAVVTVLPGEGARAAAGRVVATWGGRAVTMPPDADRRRYHLALALASNHLTALLAWATELLEPALGRKAREVASGLALQSLESFRESGGERSLTGPVVRGDAEVIEEHLRSLRGRERARYRGLLEPVLALAEASGRLPAERAAVIRRLLDS